MAGTVSMGFDLWIEEDLAWARGAYEYRALGAAVIARSQLFRERDFSPARRGPASGDPSYAGQFASIGHLNQYLAARRRLRRRPGKCDIRGCPADPARPARRPEPRRRRRRFAPNER